jgi:hypothetical protein
MQRRASQGGGFEPSHARNAAIVSRLGRFPAPMGPRKEKKRSGSRARLASAFVLRSEAWEEVAHWIGRRPTDLKGRRPREANSEPSAGRPKLPILSGAPPDSRTENLRTEFPRYGDVRRTHLRVSRLVTRAVEEGVTESLAAWHDGMSAPLPSSLGGTACRSLLRPLQDHSWAEGRHPQRVT